MQNWLIAAPDAITTASANLETLGGSVQDVVQRASGLTSQIPAMASDEVSGAVAAFFSGHGSDFQQLSQRAAAYYEQFVATVNSAGSAYAAAEAANADTLFSTLRSVTSPAQSLFAGATTSAEAAAATTQAVVQPTLQGTTVSLVMGGSGRPIPSASWVSKVMNWVNYQSFDVLAANANSLFTPEGLYPLTGIKDLTMNVSVARGVTILDDAIQSQIAADPTGSVVVMGYSQSAIIASLQMQALASASYTGTVPDATQLGFTLLGNPMNPNGGLFQRFTPLQIPSLGLTFYGATPSDTIYPTNVYTLQYDGYADFPRYPLNVLSVLNAFMGIETIHGMYPDLDPNNLPAGYNLVQQPTSDGYAGVTNYYMITYEDLPLLAPLRAIPVIGDPLADLVQPNMKILVNLGYGDPNYGYSTDPADVATPFGLFPNYSPIALAGDLWTGTQQGISAFSSDLSGLSLTDFTDLLSSTGQSGTASAVSALSSGLSLLSSPDNLIDGLQTFNTNVSVAFSGAIADSLAVIQPTADIATALAVSVPLYNVDLFLSGIQQAVDGDVLGGLQYALVAPLAATSALTTLSLGFEAVVLLDAASNVVDDLSILL